MLAQFGLMGELRPPISSGTGEAEASEGRPPFRSDPSLEGGSYVQNLGASSRHDFTHRFMNPDEWARSPKSMKSCFERTHLALARTWPALITEFVEAGELDHGPRGNWFEPKMYR